MLDIKYVVSNIDEVIENLSTRQANFEYLRELVDLNTERSNLIQENELLKNHRNVMSKKVGELIRQGNDKEVEKIRNDIQAAKDKIEQLDHKLADIEGKIKEILDGVPNIPDQSVPVGKDEDENVEVKRWGEIPNIDNPKHHLDLAQDLDIIDMERGAKLAGTRFVVYKGLGAKLQRALMNFMLDFHTDNGFLEITPPVLAKPDILYGTGNLPKFEEDVYHIKSDDLYLIPTAEVSLTNLHANEILAEERLPLYYCAYTPCFRQEAGSAGKDTKGIIRLHQFYKVEMVKIVKQEDSYEELEKMLLNAEELLKLLEIPYRVLSLCTGDMGFASAKTYDVELWMPSQNKYREVSSCSNCVDFQARRMNTKYRSADKNLKYVHTLNGSGLAIDRIIAAIIENYQTERNTVMVPKVLRKYMNDISEIK